MRFLQVALVSLIGVQMCLASGKKYPENAQDWDGTCRTGTRQSPINILSYMVEYNPDLEKLQFKNHENVKGTWENTGSTFQFTVFDVENAPMLVGAKLKEKFYLNQLHFHWSSIHSNRGSEHTVDGESRPIEMHLVHSRRAEFGSQVAEELAVVSIMFQETKNGNSELSKSFKEMTKKLEPTVATEDKTEIPKHIVPPKATETSNINLSKLLPRNLKEFYVYEGSLTTPGCGEKVEWIVLKNPVEMSTEEMDVLRNFGNRILPAVNRDTDEEIGPDDQEAVPVLANIDRAAGNYRNTQPLNGRVVYASFPPSVHCGGMKETVPGVLIMSVLVVFKFM